MRGSIALSVVLSTALLAIAAGSAQNQSGVSEHDPVHFVPFGAGLPASGQWREGFRIADMNGDGHPDIVHGPPRKQPGNPPVVFLGDGKGSWTRWKDAHFPAVPYDYGDIEVADFNGDGHPDLALAVHLLGLLVLTGDGHGTFARAGAGLEFDSEGRFSSRAIRALDWDGDGIPDLVAVWEGPRPGKRSAPGAPSGAAIFLNQGARGWQPSEAALSPGIFSDALALGDFDGDGHLDIATGSSVLGRRDLVNLWRPNGSSMPVELDLRGPNHYVQAVGAGDFDKDGRDDLAVAYLQLENEVWYSVIDVFFFRGGGKWERRPLFRQASKNVAVALASGHLRSQDCRDLVALTMQGETLVYLGDGHGGLVRANGAIPAYGGGCRGAHVELADLDGDGRDEIVTSFADEASGLSGPATCSSEGGITAWKAAANRQ